MVAAIIVEYDQGGRPSAAELKQMFPEARVREAWQDALCSAGIVTGTFRVLVHGTHRMRSGIILVVRGIRRLKIIGREGSSISVAIALEREVLEGADCYLIPNEKGQWLSDIVHGLKRVARDRNLLPRGKLSSPSLEGPTVRLLEYETELLKEREDLNKRLKALRAELRRRRKK